LTITRRDGGGGGGKLGREECAAMGLEPVVSIGCWIGAAAPKFDESIPDIIQMLL
jgi:hypothetical protein